MCSASRMNVKRLHGNLSHRRVRNPHPDPRRTSSGQRIGCAQSGLNTGLGSPSTEEVSLNGFRARAAADRVRGSGRSAPRERSRASRKRSSSCGGASRTRPSGSGPSRSGCSRPRVSSPRPCPRTRSCRPRLREAREHIAALREEVEKLTMPPSAYGTYLGTNDDGTVDIFTAGRKMRVAVHPELEIDGAAARPGGRAERVAERRARAQLRPRGRDRDVQGAAARRARARWSSGAPTRSACASSPTSCSHEKLRAGDHLLMEGRSGLLLEKLPRPEVEELVLEEVPDVSYDDVGGLDDQIEMIKDAVELPYLYGDLFKEHDLQPPKGILLVRPARLRQDAHREGGRQLARQARRGEDRQHHGAFVLLEHQGPGAAQQVRRRDRAPDPPDLPAGAREERRGLPRHRVLRRDGLAVPHARHRHLERHRIDDRAAAARGDRRRRGAEERDRDRRVEPRRSHRPRDPASRSPRREDQDRAPRRRQREADLHAVPHDEPAARRARAEERGRRPRRRGDAR